MPPTLPLSNMRCLPKVSGADLNWND